MRGFSLFILALSFVCIASTAKADFDAGLKAFDDGNYKKAFQTWSDAAEEGDLAAQRNLGHLYRWGKGVPRNPARAAYWYHRAAKVGFDRAQYNLAMLYLKGEGVPKDDVEALRWLTRSARQGNEYAIAKLAQLKRGENILPPEKDVIGQQEGGNEVSRESDSPKRAPEDMAKMIAAAPAAASTPKQPAKMAPQVLPSKSPLLVPNNKKAPANKKALKQAVNGKTVAKKKRNGKLLWAHIGSYRQSSHVSIGWKYLNKVAKDPSAFVKRVEFKDLGKKRGKYYRLYAEGLASDVRALCDTIKKKGDFCTVSSKKPK